MSKEIYSKNGNCCDFRVKPTQPLGTAIGLVNSKQCRQIPRIRHLFSGEIFFSKTNIGVTNR